MEVSVEFSIFNFHRKSIPSTMGISPAQLRVAFQDEMIRSGASSIDVSMWHTLMTEAAVNKGDSLGYLHKLLDLALHTECHPVNLIHTARGMGDHKKIDDDFMKTLHHMVSDEDDDQRETDEFWKDADGVIHLEDCDDDSGSYETTSQEESPEPVRKSVENPRAGLAGVKRRLVPRIVDDEAEEINTQA